MQGIDIEVLLASGYAIFLASVAAGFELAFSDILTARCRAVWRVTSSIVS